MLLLLAKAVVVAAGEPAVPVRSQHCLRDQLAGGAGEGPFTARDAFMLGDVRSGRLLWWYNRKLLAGRAWQPGSVFKLVVTYSLLVDRHLDPASVYDCRGNGNRDPGTNLPRCWLRYGHGAVNLARALAVSCNLYFAHYGSLLGAEAILRQARNLGLGRKTGTDLGGEVAGSLPRALGDDEMGRFATGQHPRLLVTAAQLFSLMAAIANGGELVAPMIAGGEIHPPAGPPNAQVLDFIRRALVQASLAGTGREQRLDRFLLAGKTGTAGWPETPWITHAWYVGFFPWDDPRLVLVVFKARGTGSHEAAGAAAWVMERYLRARQACQTKGRP